MKGYFKTIISTVLCYLMVLSMIPLSAMTTLAVSYTGSGTEDDPYVVSTGAELMSVLELYNAEGVHIKLDNDITLDETYVPTSFYGVFDGDFHKITAVTQFFTTNDGTLKNFYYTDTVDRIDVPSGSAGIICDVNKGLVSGVIARGNIDCDCFHTKSGDNDRSAATNVGLIAGSNSGTIINCAGFGSAKTSCSYGSRAGGISSNGDVYNCYVSATVAASGGGRYGSGKSHPISCGMVKNSYFDKDVYNSTASGGITSAEIKNASFIKILNDSESSTDSRWIQDTTNKNQGFPILERALNAVITSNKDNVLLEDGETIKLQSSVASAKIYYTLDGSVPTASSKLFSGYITVGKDATIRAVAYKDGLYSKVFTFSYCKISGDGSKENPYIIDSTASFMAIPELENDAYYLITKDITLYDEMVSVEDFFGNIDGQGHTISNIYSTKTKNGFIYKNYGIIQNINFSIKENCQLMSAAGFVIDNYGVVYNCNYSGDINGGVVSFYDSLDNAGGIVANNYGRIEKCSFDGYFYCDDVDRAGGIVGHNEGVVLYCDFKGEVNIYSVSFTCKQGYVGGLVGYTTNTSIVKYCNVTAARVHGAPYHYSGVYVGGFVGNSGTTAIVDCTAEVGTVTCGSFYTEWGYNGTHMYIGVTELGYKPKAHEHYYEGFDQPPYCGRYRYADLICECGEKTTSYWYDSTLNYYHDYQGNDFELYEAPTCDKPGILRRACIVCGYYDEIEMPATEHLGQGTIVDSSLYPESLHNQSYGSTDPTFNFTYPGADKLVVIFNGQSYISSSDLYIYDGKNNLIAQCDYTLAGKVVVIPGDTFKIKYEDPWSSDYGFAFSEIRAYSVPVSDKVLIDKSQYIESNHNYSSNLNETKTFTYPGATSLEITFSGQTEVESNYDYIYIYDKNDNQIGKYTGTSLAGKTITVQGDTFKIKLTSDVSVVRYGYSFSSIYAVSGGYGEWETIINPTCTTAGEKQRICSICNYIDTETVDMLGHKFTNYISDNNATYTENGTKTAKCDRCDETNTVVENDSKLSPVSIEIETPPDKIYYIKNDEVDFAGLTFRAKYSDGGDMVFSDADITSYIADTSDVGIKEVTITYMDCTVTFDIYVHNTVSELIDKSLYPESAHYYANNTNETKTFTYSGAKQLVITFNSNTRVENTHDKIYIYNGNGSQIGVYTGNELAGKTITVQGDTFKIKLTSDSSVTYYGYKIDSIYTGTNFDIYHPEVIDPATATCTEAGLTQGSHCEICGVIIVEQVEIEGLGHSFSNYVSDNNSTCKEDGTKTAKCDRCDATDTITEENTATGHDYNIVVTEPTCTNQGFTTYVCGCGYSYTDDYVDKIDHKYNSEITTPATHINEGIKTFTCECGDSYTEAIEKLAQHTYDNVVVSEPTCIDKGFTTYTCICGDFYISDYVDVLDHKYKSEITTPATHTSEGVKTFTCECGDSYTEVVEKITQHTYDKVVTEATCTEKGFTTYTCICGDTYISDYVDILDHQYKSEITTPATHTSEGVKTFICKCGDSYTEKIDKTTLHTYDNIIVTEPTCTDKGYTTYTCICGDSYIANYVNETGHSFTDYISDGKATCTIDGAKTAKCDNCDVTDSILEKGGHKFSDSWTIDVNPTCIKEGSKSHHCLNCSEKTNITIIDKLPHTYNVTIIDPDCTNKGYKVYTCVCGDNHADTIPAKGHTESEWITDVNSSCANEGSKHIECTVCEEIIKTQLIEKLPHNYKTVVTAPTCEESGYTTYTCECGYTYTGDSVPATGHSYNNGICSGCGDDKTADCSCNCHKSGILKIIFKIVLVFQKIFKTNKVCSCGVNHY